MAFGSWNFKKLMSLTSEGDFSTMVAPVRSNVRPSFKNNIRALIVDDNRVCCRILKVSLAKLGVESKEAKNGQVAIRMFTEEPFHIVFMEQQLEMMDGIQATKLLREMGVKVKIIGLTTDNCHRQIFLAAGVDEFWEKPFRMANLISVLREVDENV